MKIWWLLLGCASAFGQNLQITTEPSKKPAQQVLEETSLIAGGAFGAVVFEQLTSSGQLKLNGTTVNQKLRVDGSLLTQGAHLNAVEVRGEANFKNTIFAQAVQIIGSLRAEKSTFQDKLTVSGIKALLIGSKLNAVHVVKDPSFRGHQVLELRQRTTIDGPIVFESGKGEVHCHPGCYVLGSITGGKLIKKN